MSDLKWVLWHDVECVLCALQINGLRALDLSRINESMSKRKIVRRNFTLDISIVDLHKNLGILLPATHRSRLCLVQVKYQVTHISRSFSFVVTVCFFVIDIHEIHIRKYSNEFSSCYTLILALIELKTSIEVADQLSKLQSSCCIKAPSALESTYLNNFVSSAKEENCECSITSGRLFAYKRKNIGLRIKPCGTPYVTVFFR